jgi:[CysO sulfur-carrier protein]-S-L-cysteine hydrolase
MVISIQRDQLDEIFAHARREEPRECCGLIGGTPIGQVRTVYPTRNTAREPLVTYEAAPEDLFSAQRSMRKRGEQLLAIYHSHPRAAVPQPSATDVRLAYYPSAVYFIVGLGNKQPVLAAFRISEREGRWEAVDYEVLAG